AAPQATWRDVRIESNQVRFRQPLRLDFGGIAKGYAVDLAVEQLRAAGIAEAQVNAGGDLRVFGLAPQRIALRDPRAPLQWSQIVELDDQALATSAPYYAAGAAPSALIDPRNGNPYAGADSISVIAPNCLVADALTKVALFATPSRLEALLEQHDAQLLIQRCAD
ncbi:FAD:protein FMN transferase, partial [uncultured Nevskia sp.]|uniref:FAD:protein FMN transferase n=1 Tax=uncultured Nevskia sp. TaxID=228950 RepID=UPI0025CE1E0A